MKKNTINYIKDIKDFEHIQKGTVMLSRQYTPSHWLNDGKTETVKALKTTMTCGGGMGGSKWTIYIVGMTLDELANSEGFLIVNLYDDECRLINTANIVDATEVNIVSAYFHSDNYNFETGTYKKSILTTTDAKVVLTNARNR